MAVPIAAPAPLLAPLAAVSITPAVPPTPEGSEMLAEVTPRQAVQAIVRANRDALVRPGPTQFHRAQVVYPWCDGCIYVVELAYQTPTHLVWPPGEFVLSKAQEDWFQVDQKTLGEPSQDHLLVTSKLSKAAFPELAKRSFRMTVLTTKGVYHLHLHVQDDPERSMTSVTWAWPKPPRREGFRLTPGLYHTGYGILGDPARVPPWTPIGVWDTGIKGQTLIRFPATLHTAAAPLLYVLDPAGTRHLTTYTPHGPWYVVDQLFEAAELRVGHDETAEVVTLRRSGSYRSIQCPGDAACPAEVQP